MPFRRGRRGRIGKRRTATPRSGTNVMIIDKIVKRGVPMTVDYSLNLANVIAAGEVLVNVACFLSQFLNSPSAAATVTAPVFTAGKFIRMRVTAPGAVNTAATIPETLIITWYSDDGENIETTYKNPGSSSVTVDVVIPPNSRAAKGFRSLLPTAVEGSGAVIRLVENLFSLSAVGATEQDWIISIDYEGVLGLSTSPEAGGGAIVTWNPAPGLVGNFFVPLDCISPTSFAFATAYPNLIVGTWLMTPMLPPGQCVATKPTGFTRTIG